MLEGLSLAQSGLLADEDWESVLSGDLANIDTPGFKSELAVVGSDGQEALTDTAGGSGIGALSEGAALFETVPDLSEGTVRTTGDPLDIALDGPGFMAVQTSQGTLYTRDGALSLDAQGRLVTASGDPVLSTAGGPIVAQGGAEIGPDGQVRNGAATVGTIALFAPTLGQLTDVGGGLFAAQGPVAPDPGATRIAPASLEASNVDASQVLGGFIQVSTQFDAGQNLVKELTQSTDAFIQAAG